MVVCKFFLQGTCKFGSYCHFEHQLPTNYNYTNFNENSQQSTSILRQANFGTTQTQNAKPPTTSATIDVNTLVKSVVTDMMGAEKGGQWLMSCYAPFKEKPAFPGFEDQSPEEIRLGFYEAQKNGTMDQYKQQLQMLLQNAVVKVRALQNPSPDVIAILQNIYSSSASSGSGTYGQNTTSTTSFGQQANNVFATQNKTPFGQGAEVFNTNTQQSSNIFGAASPNNIFGGSQTTQPQTNIFAIAASPSQSQNIFGGSSTFPGSQNTGFGTPQQNNIFTNAGPAPTAPNSVFGVSATNPPAFGNPQPSTNVFASPQQNMFGSQALTQPMPQNIFAAPSQPHQTVQQNIFASQSTEQNIFSANSNVPLNPTLQQNPATPPSYSSTVFGGAPNSSVSFGSVTQQTVDESIYSKLEELDVEEKKWFESDTLDVLNIPDKPPTYDMCFKV